MGKTLKTLAVVMLLALILLVACGDDKETIAPTETPGPPGTSTPPPEEVTITIGNLTDITGVSANAQEVINFALDDLVRYFNDENLIPGVKLSVKTYDGQFDPAKDIPGYEWLRERGADLIVTGVTSAPVTLKSRVDRDKVPLFSLSGNLETVEPPGYVFAPASLPEHEALTLMKWIAENDWDYETKGPARIGGASWSEPNAQSFLSNVEAYAKAHPDQFKWEGAHLTDFTFIWGPQVEALKDCDYVLTPNPMTTFVKEYRTAGYDAKFIGNGPHIALLRMVDDADLWDEIDGMLFVTPSRWWGEEGGLVELREKLLYQNHSAGEAEEIKRMGGAYNALDNFYVVLEVIRKAAEEFGPENIDSETLYEAAKMVSLTVDGVERYSFGETKRYACNYYGIYRASDAEKTLVRADPGWFYHVTSP